MRFLVLFLALLVLALPLSPEVHAQTSPAAAGEATIESLTAEKTRLEGEIRRIMDAPKRDGESLNDEIRRKGEETRSQRRRLGQINEQITRLREQSETTTGGAVTPEAPTANSTGTNFVAPKEGEYDPTDYNFHGHGARPVDHPTDLTTGDKADVPPDDADTQWVKTPRGTPSRVTQNPNDRGWWIDKNGHKHTTFWLRKRTDCEPCKELVYYFNDTMSDLMITRSMLADMERRKSKELERFRDTLRAGSSETQRRVTEGAGSGALTATALQAGFALAEYEEAFDAVMDAYRKEIETLQKRARDLAAQIAECEKQCEDGDGRTTGITTGWGGGFTSGGVSTATSRLPFDWRGPYSTNCNPCKKLAEALNGLPEKAYKEMRKLSRAQDRLRLIRALIAYHNAQGNRDLDNILFADLDEWDEEYFDDYTTAEELEEIVEEIEADIAKYERHLQTIADYFNRVLGMLRNCEREYCPDQDQRTGYLMPGAGQCFPAGTGQSQNCSYEVETAITIFGTNAFDDEEVRRIPDMVDGTDTETTGTTTGGGTTDTGTGTDTGTTDTGTGTDTGTDTGGGTTTPTTPLSVTTSGSLTFSHSVGPSPCPTSAGSISITSNNGNPLTVSGVSLTGVTGPSSMTPVVDATVGGSGSASPTISAAFNCGDATTTTYSGTLTATVTDTVTGETATISVPVTGTVM